LQVALSHQAALSRKPMAQGVSHPTPNDGEKTFVCQSVRNGEGHTLLKKAFAVLGPGSIIGAADDDPSGISTYSVAGAAYRYATLWIERNPPKSNANRYS
jgi:hypothetical protein